MKKIIATFSSRNLDFFKQFWEKNSELWDKLSIDVINTKFWLFMNYDFKSTFFLCCHGFKNKKAIASSF